MPIRQLALLLGLFCLCLAIIGIAWASGSELFLFIPGRRGSLHRPPTHPGVFLALIGLSVAMTWFVGEVGGFFLAILTIGMLLGSLMGFLMFQWIPTWSQHFLSVAMIATTIYYWKQRDYFED